MNKKQKSDLPKAFLKFKKAFKLNWQNNYIIFKLLLINREQSLVFEKLLFVEVENKVAKYTER